MVNVHYSENHEEFIFLKGLLCLIGASRLNCCVKVDGKPIDDDNVVKEAMESINNLRDNLDIPFHTLRTDRSVINFFELLEALKQFDSEERNITNLKQKQLKRSDVYNKPDIKALYALYYDGFIKESGLFINQRVAISKIIDFCEGYMNRVCAFISYKDSTVTVSEAVTLINMLEGIEYAFSLSEIGEPAFQIKTEFTELFDVSALKNMIYNNNQAKEMPGVEVDEMIDEDRLSGLTAEEIEEVIVDHNGVVGEELDHGIEMAEGFESLMRSKFNPNEFSGSERYFIGGMSPYAIVGSEAGFWDNIKESSKVVYETLSKAIREISNYFTGDGTKQIDTASSKLDETIEAMQKLNGDIPIPEGSTLLVKTKFFKAPALDGLDDSDLAIVKTAISNIEAAVNKLDSVKNISGLVVAYKAIGDASIAASKTITDQIKKDASEATASVNKINNISIPSDTTNEEVKTAKKEEVQENLKDAKDKGKGVKKIASLRNKFLAPALVVSSSLSGVEKLKENKEFKG